jgi:AcrR family transcriptional regulator
VTLARPEPRQHPRRASEIIAAARVLLEREGRDALTMRRLGQALGIRAPSIYKHLPGKHAVEVALIETGLVEIGEALHQAADRPGALRGANAVTRLLAAYRTESLARPNLYRLATSGQLPRDELTPGCWLPVIPSWPRRCGHSRTGWSPWNSIGVTRTDRTLTGPGAREPRRSRSRPRRADQARRR